MLLLQINIVPLLLCKWLHWYRCTAGAARQVMVTRKKICHVMNLGSEPWNVVLPRRRWHAYIFRILPVVILSIHFNFLFNNNCRNLRPAHMIREPSRKDHNPSHVGGRNFSLENNYKFLKCGKWRISQFKNRYTWTNFRRRTCWSGKKAEENHH